MRALGALLLLACARRGAAAPAAAPARADLVILVSVDDWSPRHIGAYGGAPALTPRFDALAARATLFERAASASSWTRPSHMALLTSTLPSDQGIVGGYWPEKATPLSPGVVTLAEALKAAGFATAGFAAGRHLDPAVGFSRGFDVYEMRHHAPASEQTARALAWLKAHRGKRFLFLHYYDLHNQLDYDRPARGRPYFDCPQAPGAAPRLSTFTLTVGDVLDRPLRRQSAQAIASACAEYDGCVRSMDFQLGRLLDGLRRLGLYDRALLVLVSDHGERFGEFGRFSHGSGLDPGVLGVPLLVKAPGQRRGTRVHALASLLDVMPTILEAAAPEQAGRLEGQLQGQSLFVLARSGRRDGAAFAEDTESLRADVDDAGWDLEQDLATGKRRLFRWGGSRERPQSTPQARRELARLLAASARRYREAERAPAPNADRWPPEGLGLTSASTQAFSVQSDASWGDWPQEGSRRAVVARSQDSAVRVSASAVSGRGAAQEAMRRAFLRLRFVYAGESAYPGMADRSLVPGDLAPSFEKGAGPGGTDAAWVTATPALSYGARSPGLIAYRGAMSFLYCPAEGRLFELELFYRKERFSRAAALADLSSFGCRVPRRVLGPLRLSGVVAPMVGPHAQARERFPPGSMLRGLKVAVRDEKGRPADGLLCHVTLARGAGAHLALPGAENILREPLRLTTAEGEYDISLPAGFGLPLDAQASYGVQGVLQSPRGGRDGAYTIDVDYDVATGSAAAALQPLEGWRVDLRQGGREATSAFVWKVPPGRHEYETAFTVPRTAAAHFIDFHLHRHAAFVELAPRDGPPLFHAGVAKRPDGWPARAPVYSSARGLELEAGTTYYFRVAYDNPGPAPEPEMAIMRLYVSGAGER